MQKSNQSTHRKANAALPCCQLHIPTHTTSCCAQRYDSLCQLNKRGNPATEVGPGKAPTQEGTQKATSQPRANTASTPSCNPTAPVLQRTMHACRHPALTTLGGSRYESKTPAHPHQTVTSARRSEKRMPGACTAPRATPLCHESGDWSARTTPRVARQPTTSGNPLKVLDPPAFPKQSNPSPALRQSHPGSGPRV